MSSYDRLRHARRTIACTVALMILVASNAAPTAGQDPASEPGAPGPFEDVRTYRVDDERTHVQPAAATREAPAVVWSVKLGDEIHFNPIILDGMLYVGDYHGVLHALDPSTGEVRWTYRAHGPIEGASASAGTIVFADDSGRLHAVAADTGEARWTADGGYVSSPTSPVVDDTAFAVTGDGVIHGHDLATGEETWSYELPAPTEAASVTIHDGILYLGTSDAMVRAISIAEERELWPPIRLLSSRPSSMPISDGILYASSNQPPGDPAGELLAIDTASGEVRWRFRSPSGRQVTPGAIRDGVLYVASEIDGLFAIDAADGAVLWRADAPFGGPPITLAGDVLITPGERDLVGLDAGDGHELWRVPLGGGADTGPAVSGGLIFQADDRGNAWAFGDARLGTTTSDGPVTTTANSTSPFAHHVTWDATDIEGLDQPSGSDIGPDGLYYFVNAGTSEIIVLDDDGVVVRRWGEHGTREGQFDFLRDRSDPFSAIGGVAVAGDGSVYVADTVNRRVQRFSSAGEFVGQFGSFGSGDGQFLEPIDLDVGADGSVYVVDDIRDDIQRFSADGTYLETIGRHGTGDGEMSFTSSIVVAGDGRLINADWGNDRVQAWDAAGAFEWSVGTRGSAPGEFRFAADVAVDASGTWFATDFENGRVQAFGPDNALLGEWSVPITDELWPVYSIASAPDGRLIVSNPFGDRIHVIEFMGT